MRKDAREHEALRGASGSRGTGRLLGTALLVLAAAAVAVRLLGVRGDLWVDEIFSVQIALDADGPLEILSGIGADNNHWLNTLWLWVVGPTSELFLYRLLSLSAGVGTLVLVTLHGLTRGWRAALTSLVLFGFSAFLVLLDSEARGYAPGVFFGLTAYVALRRFLERHDRLSGAAFACSATLGALSHVTFAWIYAGLLMWSIAGLRALAKDRDLPARSLLAGRLLGLHLIPLVVLGLLVLGDVRGLAVGGGPPHPIGQALEDLTRFGAGVHGPGWLVRGFGVGLLGVVAWEVLRRARDRNLTWMFFFVALFVGPITFATVFSLTRDLEFFYPRYLVISLPFALLLLGRALERLASAGGWRTFVWGCALAGFLLGNAFHLQGFLQDGRGHYRAALTRMVTASDGDPVRLALVGPSAQEPVVSFYAPRVPGGDRIRVHPPDAWGRTPADWILVQEFADNPPAPTPNVILEGIPFAFEERFPHWGPSGWTWDLYRRGDIRAGRTSDGPPEL